MKKRGLSSSIRTKVMLPAFILIFLSLLSLAFVLINSMEKALNTEFLSKGTVLAKALASHAHTSLQNQDTTKMQALIAEFKAIEGVAYVFIQTVDNKIAAHSFDGNFQVESFPLLSNNNESSSSVFSRNIKLDGKNRLDVVVPIMMGKEGRVHVGMDLEILQQDLLQQYKIIFFMSILGTIFTCFILYIILNEPIGSIIYLSEISHQVQADDKILPNLELFADDEIGKLAQEFSKMIQEVRNKRIDLEAMVKDRTDKLTEAQSVAKLGSWHYDLNSKKFSWTDELFSLFELNKKEGELSLEAQSELILPEHRDEWRKAFTKCCSDGNYFNVLISTKASNGTTNYFEIQGKGLRNDSGALTALTGTCQSITEKINNEIELNAERNRSIQSSKMSTLGEMASGIAHELNNPLTVLSGFAFKLNKMATGDQEVSKSALVEYSDNIKAMIKRMGTIINGLRVFARDGSNQPKEKVQLSKVVNDSLFLCKAQFENKKIKFEVTVDDSIIIDCREILLSQVLINLLNNAYQALKNDPGIYDKFVNLTCSVEDKWVKIVIEDNGPGVPKEFQDKIFQPFFTTKKVGEGTGLGLSISKGIIESHQGELLLEQAEKLTRFIIKLPK